MRRGAALVSVLAAAAAVLVFAPSLRHGFVNWDDNMFLLGQVGWRGFGPAQWLWALRATVGGVWQPLAWWSYGLDYAVWGLEPFGLHLTGVLLHSASAALVALLALDAMRLSSVASVPGSKGPGRELSGDEEDRSSFAGALLAALVFALHPLRVESVSWAAERRDVLCGLLMIAALWAYVRAGRSGGGGRAVIILQGLALLAKAQAAVLPVLLLVIDAWPLGRFSDPRPGPFGPGTGAAEDSRIASSRRWMSIKVAVVEKAPLWALSAGCMAIAAAVQHRMRWPLSQHGVAGRLAQTAYGLAFYARKTAWPTGLAPLYELRPPLDPRSPPFLLSILAVAVVAVFAWRQRARRPWLAAAGAFYAAALGPVLGLTQFGPQIAADRYSYVACLPAALIAGASLREALRRRAWRVPAAFAACGIVAALAALCVRQQSVWRDSESLWTRVAEIDAASATAQLGLGTLRAQEGRIAAAAAFFDAALARDGGCVPAQDRLAEMSRREAPASPEAAALAWEIERRPVCRKARLNRAVARAQLGDLSGAERELMVIAASTPEDGAARANLARVQSLLAPRRRPR